MFVLVAGPPGSGKSTLARPLATELGLPLLAKDDVKEALVGALGVPADVDASRRVGSAAVMAVLAVAAECPAGAVIDSTFYPYTLSLLRALPGRLVEVRCVCPREVARERYVARSAGRGRGHFDDVRTEAELWDDHLAGLGVGPVVEVDTSAVVPVAAVARKVREVGEAREVDEVGEVGDFYA